jgi:pimeloyl-ACP methyl ester carboxylesterase
VLVLALGLGGPGRPRALASPTLAPSTPVEFSSVGGVHLRGRQYGGGASWVILVHDEGQDSRAWRGLPPQLTAQGFRVLAFDLRGYGASDGPRDARRERADIAAALGFARSRGARRLYVIGAGVGAGAALVAASTYSIRAFVALSPRRSGRDNPEQTRAPKLIFVGSLDDRAAAQADDVFRRSIGFATLNSTPVDVQGTKLLRSAWGDDVRELIVIFLRDYVS